MYSEKSLQFDNVLSGITSAHQPVYLDTVKTVEMSE